MSRRRFTIVTLTLTAAIAFLVGTIVAGGINRSAVVAGPEMKKAGCSIFRSLKACRSPKAATSMATMACPVLVALVSSWLKSITSLPIAAAFRVPASKPTTSASPYPL